MRDFSWVFFSYKYLETCFLPGPGGVARTPGFLCCLVFGFIMVSKPIFIIIPLPLL